MKRYLVPMTIMIALVLLLAGCARVSDNKAPDVQPGAGEAIENQAVDQGSSSVPGTWEVVKKGDVQVDGQTYEIAFEATSRYLGLARVVVSRYDAEKGERTEVWRSQSFGDDEGRTKILIREDDELLYIAGKNDRYLVLADFPWYPGAHYRIEDLLLFSISKDGVKVLDTLEICSRSHSGEVKGDKIFCYLNDDGGGPENEARFIFYLDGDKYVKERLFRSDLIPKGLFQVRFSIDSNNKIVPVSPGVVTVQKGEKVAFVPNDKKTREKFDRGDILLYRSTPGDRLMLVNANELHESWFEAEETGEYSVLVESYDEESRHVTYPEPTFIIRVIE